MDGLSQKQSTIFDRNKKNKNYTDICCQKNRQNQNLLGIFYFLSRSFKIQALHKMVTQNEHVNTAKQNVFFSFLHSNLHSGGQLRLNLCLSEKRFVK